MKRYEQVPHTADIAARVYGRSMEELFENAAFAMFDMSYDLEGLGEGEVRVVEVEAEDKEDLLVSWLNELLYRSFSTEVMFNNFKITFLTDTKLSAEVNGVWSGESADRLLKEIKAATYHDLKIEHTDNGYEVTIVFDV